MENTISARQGISVDHIINDNNFNHQSVNRIAAELATKTRAV